MVAGSGVLQIKKKNYIILSTVLVQILGDKWQGLKILQAEQLVTLVIIA